MRCPTIKLDLTLPDHVALLLEMLDDPDLVYVHMAPPCGTSSRARDIRRKHGYDPPKVRTTTQPDGLKNLSPTLQKRVDLANKLYDVAAQVANICFTYGIFFSVENPWRSYMWLTSMWQQTKNIPLRDAIFSHCMFGSRRAKKTRIKHVIPAFDCLNVLCNGQHVHDKWGRSGQNWATSEETAYPIPLCVAIATALLDELKTHGCVMPPQSLSDINLADLPQHRAGVGVQSRGKRLPPLVSNYKNVAELVGPRALLNFQTFDSDFTVPASVSCKPPMATIPAGSRILRTISTGGNGEYVEHNEDTQILETMASDPFEMKNNVDCVKLIVGIPWTIDEFIYKASCAKHPQGLVDGLDESLKATISYLATTSDSNVAADRTEAIRAMMRDIISCKERETEIREQMPEHCRRIMAAKRLALFEKLVADVGHGDTTIAAEMAVGFDMVGKIPRSQVYRKKKRPATLSVSELRRCAPKTRKAIYHSCKGSGDFDMDMAVYEATRDELKRGWLHGPCAFDELPDHSTVTRRFGVKQGAKTRPIDNYTESLVNLTTSAGETITLHNVDAICAMLGFWHTLTGGGKASEVVLKTCDLHKAYKQLCVSRDALDDSYLAVWNPKTKRTEVYGQYVLPFGSCASVHAFCRSSFAIWFVGVRKFRLMWSSYFDDFVIFSKPALSKHNDFVLKTFFQALGWAVSLDKDSNFGPVAKVLGMEIDLAESHLACTVVRNTLERKGELKSLLDAVLDSGKLSMADGMKLRGRFVC